METAEKRAEAKVLALLVSQATPKSAPFCITLAETVVKLVMDEITRPDETMLESGRRELAIVVQGNKAYQCEITRMIWNAMVAASRV